MSDFEIEIASFPTREYVVAEISQETGDLRIQFYSPLQGGYWEFSYDEALQALNQAKKRLLGIS